MCMHVRTRTTSYTNCEGRGRREESMNKEMKPDGRRIARYVVVEAMFNVVSIPTAFKMLDHVEEFCRAKHIDY